MADRIVFAQIVVLGLPTIVYYCIFSNLQPLLPLHLIIPTLYLLTSILVIAEATVAGFWPSSKRRHPRVEQSLQPLSTASSRIASSVVAGGRSQHTDSTVPASYGSVPRCSVIVVAYLPNEQGVILGTLRHLLNNLERPEQGLEIILAYNTPTRLPVEADLHRLAALHPELRLLLVEGSRSKAENLNAAVQIATGEMTCIIDADHRPIADCLERAWNWLRDGDYDVVQGRNVIRNYRCNLLTRLVAVEFECLYGISHPAKSLLVDTAIFGGSNGYWRTSVLRKIRFRPGMMTEDIDATLRALLAGYRIVHDRNIISTELAPLDLRSLWAQRKRWDQGWGEVSLKYQWPLWRSDKLNLGQKLYWTCLLCYRVIFQLTALQVFPMLFGLVLSGNSTPDSIQTYVLLTTILTLLSGPYQTLIALKVRSGMLRAAPAHFLFYCLALPFYAALKNTISVVALYDHIMGRTDWVVTPRGLMSFR
ncbi:glycosyltransferase family 2 protein [Leptolyngbya sp. FACHB-261]|nr:glycosyltransferase family 2 protein [Leptolyngbya sp. FACHB-261]